MRNLSKFLLIGFISCLASIRHAARAQYGFDTVSVYFEIGKSSLLKESVSVLDSVSRLITNENRKILIYGYADYLGNGKPNYTLSESRSQRVLHYLLKKKVPKSAVIQTTGVGQINERGKDVHGNQDYRKVDIFIKRNAALGINLQSSTAIAKKIKAKKTGETFVLEDVFFHYNSSRLTEASVPRINELYEALRYNPNWRISLEGHVCCVEKGLDAWDEDINNAHLSSNRAFTIYRFLIDKGIDKDRISYKGFGKNYPIREPEDTEEDKEKNRRVEVRVMKPKI